MKIETKYNLGQEVWIILFEEPILCVVEGVVCYNLKISNWITYQLTLKNGSSCSFTKEECEIFPSKEEALKSL